jgi:uncharacterized protein with PQ loop repeat
MTLYKEVTGALNTVQIVTAIAAFLAILWTLVQIVAYAREKNPKDIKIALILIVIIGLLLLLYPHLKGRIQRHIPGFGPTATRNPYHHPLANPSIMVSSPVSGSFTPSVTPTGSPDARPSTEPSGGPVSPGPGESTAAPLPCGSITESPGEPAPKGELKSSFFIDIKRNVIGGIGDISAHCTFAEVGGVNSEIVAYKIIINYLEAPSDSSDKSVARSFERALKDRIQVHAGTTVEKVIDFDNEIGDLVLKSKKSGKSGWIRVLWEGKDERGNALSSESTANRPE